MFGVARALLRRRGTRGPTVALHLGAHKTATTFIQHVLRQNLPALHEHGVGYVPMLDFRPLVTRQLGRMRGAGGAKSDQWNSVAASLDGMVDGGDWGRFVISDENLTGDIVRIVTTGRLYEQPRRKLKPLERMLAGRPVELYFAVRDYGDFSRAAYTEVLQAHGPNYVAPDEFRAAWSAAAPGWVRVIEELLAVFPGAPVTVWDYAAMRRDEQAILNLVAGTSDLEFVTKGVFRRKGLTHDATVALQEIAEADGIPAMKARVKDMKRRFPPGPANRPYELWDKAAREAFDKQYAADLDKIAGMDPRVTLIR